MHNFKKFFLFLIIIGIFSCEDNIREVAIFEKGSIEIIPSTLTVAYGETIDFASNAVKAQSLKWTFEGGDPATSIDENVTVRYNAGTGEFENTYQVKLEVKYIDNQTETKTISIVVAADPNYTPPVTGGGGGGGPLGPQNIAFVTDNVVGDQGYIDLLEGAGHTVEAEAGKYNQLNAAGAATLNGFDLVIISRNTNSVNFDANYLAAWSSVTTPVLNLSSYVARSSRLQYFNSASQIEGAGNSMKAVLPTHPVFTNVTMDANNTFDVTAAGLHVVVDSKNTGNGTLIGTTGNDTYATIAEWDANTAAYSGATVFKGKRMFLAGTGGGFTYNAAGSQLFLNCVEYIITGTVYVPKQLNIVFVTQGAATDAGYITLLEGAGHTVEAIDNKYNSLNDSPNKASLIANLNAADLVIISRNTNSAEFDVVDAGAWATVTKPVLNLSSYVARSTRLQFFNSASQSESGGTKIVAQNPSHPIFNGISLEADNSLVVTTGSLHVIVSNNAGNGTLLGLTENGSNATIAEWNANTAAYTGATVFPSKRMYLASTVGYTYNDAGAKLFLNCVNYITN